MLSVEERRVRLPDFVKHLRIENYIRLFQFKVLRVNIHVDLDAERQCFHRSLESEPGIPPVLSKVAVHRVFLLVEIMIKWPLYSPFDSVISAITISNSEMGPILRINILVLTTVGTPK